MQNIFITPTILPNSIQYPNVQNAIRQINPYNSGCNANQQCYGYLAMAKCLIDIYQGVRTCQTIYLVDKNRDLLDLSRLEWIDITITNEYGCSVYWFSTREMEFYNGIEIMQTYMDASIVKFTAGNWEDLEEDYVFDSKNVAVSDGIIHIGDSTHFGELILNPVTYNERLYITAVPHEENGGSFTVKMNGIPNIVVAGQRRELMDVNPSTEAVLDISNMDSNYQMRSLNFDSIELETVGSIQHKGEIKICFESYENRYLIPSNVNAVITIKFKDDDEEEQGGTHIIDCVPIGRVRKNINLSDENETPIISHEIKPELIKYDNTESGLQSTLMMDAMAEMEVLVNDTKGDKFYRQHYDCAYDEARSLYYWDVFHNQGMMYVNVTTKDDDENDIVGNVQYISDSHLRIYFTQCVNGWCYIN